MTQEEINMLEGNVIIPLEVYEDLNRDVDNYFMLREALYKHADLSQRGEYLMFDSEHVSMALSLIDSNRYNSELDLKQKEFERSISHDNK